MSFRSSALSAALAVVFVVLGSTGDGVRAQAPGRGPSIAPRSKRQHPLLPPGQGMSQAQPQGPSDNSPVVLSGTWQAITTPPASVDNCLLLTDGSVMCHGYASTKWYKLTPTAAGSYVSGTWTTLASMQAGYAPIYFSSAVLPDGRVIVEGGEYNCTPNCTAVWGTQGSIYNPVTKKADRIGMRLLEDGRPLPVANVIWCTGYHPGFDWIELPVFDEHVQVKHRSGLAVLDDVSIR
jgi:hypothetical protein